MNFRGLIFLIIGLTLTSALVVCPTGERQIIYTTGEGVATRCLLNTAEAFSAFVHSINPIILWDSANPQVVAPSYRSCNDITRPGTNCILPAITAVPTCRIAYDSYVSVLWSVNASTLEYPLNVPAGPDNLITPSIYYQGGQTEIPAHYVGPLFWQDIPLVRSGASAVLPGPVEFSIPGIVGTTLANLNGIPFCNTLCTGTSFEACVAGNSICGWTFTLPDLTNAVCRPITQNLISNDSTVIYTQNPPSSATASDSCSCHTDCVSCASDRNCAFCDTTNTCSSAILAANTCPSLYPSVLHTEAEECPSYCGIENSCDGYTLYDSLRALYLSTDGQYWNQQSGWNGVPSIDPCYWHGIDCVARTIDLSGNNLVGSINPVFFCALKDFKSINLSNNKLVGCLPNTIALTNLQILDVRNNNLSCAVPDFGQMTNSIQYLYLQNNSFVGPFPADIPNSIYIKEFHLNNNDISGQVPVGLAQLSELLEASFNCQKNNMLVTPYKNFMNDLRSLLNLSIVQLPDVDFCDE